MTTIAEAHQQAPRTVLNNLFGLYHASGRPPGLVFDHVVSGCVFVFSSLRAFPSMLLGLMGVGATTIRTVQVNHAIIPRALIQFQKTSRQGVFGYGRHMWDKYVAKCLRLHRTIPLLG